MPFDVTPGGHRRYDVEEAVAALRAQHPVADPQVAATELFDPVPYVAVPPASEVAVTATVTTVEAGDAPVHDRPADVEDWAAETPVV